MEFRDNPAIYIQIAEYVCEQILLQKWKLGDKIISTVEDRVKLASYWAKEALHKRPLV